MSNRSLTISSDNLINDLYISNSLNTGGQSFTKVIPVSTPTTIVPDSDNNIYTTIFKLSPSDSGSLIIISDLITAASTIQRIRLPLCKDSVGCKFSFLVTSRNAALVFIDTLVNTDFISGNINFTQSGPTQITAFKARHITSQITQLAPIGTFVQFWCMDGTDWVAYNCTTSGLSPFF